jgi:hypothetical protein
MGEERRLRVSVNRVLRRIFEPKDEVTGEWRKLPNEELSFVYFSPNIIRVIKSRRMRLTGHVARMTDRRVHTGFGCGNLREKNHLEDSGVDGRKIIRWMSGKWDGGHGLDHAGSG